MPKETKELKGLSFVLDVSPGARIMLDGEGELPCVIFVDRDEPNKLARGALILQRAEAERLRDILDTWLAGNRNAEAYSRFETDWISVLKKSRAWIKNNQYDHARAFAVAHHIAKLLPDARPDYFVVGSDIPSEDPTGVH